MKKLILSLVMFVQLGFAMADNKTPNVVVQSKYDNVKVFQQPGTSTTIIATVTTDDRVEFVRKWNRQWAIVKLNDKVGYVLFSELTNLKTTNTQPKNYAIR